MPELPEVETTRRGIEPHLLKQRISRVEVRDGRLRWPVPDDFATRLQGAQVKKLTRRGKYILVHTSQGVFMVHLGMSGSLRVITDNAALKKHDHVIFTLSSGHSIRFHDPRRFGCILWANELDAHPLLAVLGPEPLAEEFDADYLINQAKGRKTAVKSFLMDAHVVVGVGNIYANEALFMAGIHPKRQAGRVSAARYEKLVSAVKQVLGEAIAVGGTTLRDFVNGNGEPGYFQQQLRVYDRAGEPCKVCGSPIKSIRLGQRSTFFCKLCQT
ncbi:MAG TPA: bifunctional DNA-formamidopyrimidine glycosylase/DNA-(apurinic or apyrimidinic site) lyase [Pseudomonadales bacterium]|nr:bifunctional DNA-formamidopyrimidine glycosylase/DNA-(apurinic or apyrimidinic site) lyase [Pseudomonadales bacterium]